MVLSLVSNGLGISVIVVTISVPFIATIVIVGPFLFPVLPVDQALNEKIATYLWTEPVVTTCEEPDQVYILPRRWFGLEH